MKQAGIWILVLLTLSLRASSLVVLDEGFEKYAIGSTVAGQGNWTGPFFQYTGDPRDTLGPTVVSSPVSSGDKAACWQVMLGNDGHFVTVTNTFPVEWTSGTAVMYIDVGMDATEGPGNFSYFQIFDSSGREATRIYLNRGPGLTGDIHLLGRSGGWEPSNPLWLPKIVVNPQNRVYYKLKLVIDVTNRKYDCYVGDGDRSGVNEGHWGHFEGSNLCLDGVPAVKDLYFYYGATGLARFTWLMYRFGSRFSGPAYAYCDNLYIEGPDFGSDVRRTEIWVAKGTYREQVTLREFTHIYGGFAGGEISKSDRNGLANPTIIDPGNTALGVSAVKGAPMSTVDGFVIRGGYYGVDCGQTAPTVTNNIITGNAGSGVICRGSSPLILNNTIVANGVGIEIEGGNPRIINNIVASNVLGLSGSAGQPYLSHNAFYGNSSANYVGLGSGRGDISADPLFVDPTRGDFRLLFGSPCIDSADPEVAADTDICGGSRPIDGDGDGFARADIGACESQFVPEYKELAEFRTSAEGDVVRCEDVVVTKTWSDFFYIESLDRTAGIRVDRPGHNVAENCLINISGFVRTDTTGERYVDPVAINCTGAALVRPLGIIGKAVGGSDFGFDNPAGLGQTGTMAYQKGQDEPRSPNLVVGLNNIGLLVRVWGIVTAIADDGFYLDDGSGFDDGDPRRSGIRVSIEQDCIAPQVGSHVAVTGISSCYVKDGKLFRLIRTNSPDDILCFR